MANHNSNFKHKERKWKLYKDKEHIESSMTNTPVPSFVDSDHLQERDNSSVIRSVLQFLMLYMMSIASKTAWNLLALHSMLPRISNSSIWHWQRYPKVWSKKVFKVWLNSKKHVTYNGPTLKKTRGMSFRRGGSDTLLMLWSFEAWRTWTLEKLANRYYCSLTRLKSTRVIFRHSEVQA